MFYNNKRITGQTKATPLFVVFQVVKSSGLIIFSWVKPFMVTLNAVIMITEIHLQGCGEKC